MQMPKNHRSHFLFQQSVSRRTGFPIAAMLVAVAIVAFLAAGARAVLGETWTDSTGQFQVKAQFLGLKANKVYLKKENGVVIAVPLERLSAESQQQAQRLAAPAPGAADAPDGTIRMVMTGVEQGSLRVVWDALPPSYQSDVNDLVHTFAENMDAELWNAGAGILKKAVRILKEKKQFILAHPALKQSPVDPDTISQNWDVVVDLLDTIVNSEITDLEKLKTFDGGAFLSGTGKTIGDKLMAVAHAVEGQNLPMADFPGMEVDPASLASLKDAKVSTLSVDGDTATVRIEKEGTEAKDVQMVRVEGKWLPKEMVDGWAAGIAKAKSAMSTQMGEQLKKNKQQVLAPMRMIGMVLDGILATKTQEEFNQAINSIMGMLKPSLDEGDGGPNPFGGGAKPPGGSADPFGS